MILEERRSRPHIPQLDILDVKMVSLDVRVSEMGNQLAKHIADEVEIERDIRTLIGNVNSLAISIEPLKEMPRSVERVHQRLDDLAQDHGKLKDQLVDLRKIESRINDHIDQTKEDHKIMSAAPVLYKVAILIVAALLFISGNSQFVLPFIQHVLGGP
jgi:chromosome segregation ATPase